MRNAYATTMLSGLSESCFRVESKGGDYASCGVLNYPFISTTAEVLADCIEEFKASRHFVVGHPSCDVVLVSRINTFGDVSHVWEVDMLSGHFKVDTATFLQESLR